MAHPNYKAIKNFLHNELGISKKVVLDLIEDFIQKEVERRLDVYFYSNAFESKAKRLVNEAINPIAQKEIKSRINWAKLEITITPVEK